MNQDFLLLRGKWWHFWKWRKIRRCPIEVRILKGKQVPVLLWPEELP